MRRGILTGNDRRTGEPGVDFIGEGDAETIVLNPGDGAPDPPDIADVDRDHGAARDVDRAFAHHASRGKVAHLDAMVAWQAVDAQISQEEQAVARNLPIVTFDHELHPAWGRHMRRRTDALPMNAIREWKTIR